MHGNKKNANFASSKQLILTVAALKSQQSCSAETTANKRPADATGHSVAMRSATF